MPSGKPEDNSGTKKPSARTRRGLARWREVLAQCGDCRGVGSRSQRQSLTHKGAQIGIMPSLDTAMRQTRCVEELERVFPPLGDICIARQLSPSNDRRCWPGQSRPVFSLGGCLRSFVILSLCDGGFRSVIPVSALFEFNRQFLAAAAHDPAIRHHMHMSGTT